MLVSGKPIWRMLYRPRSCRIHRQEACHFSCSWGASPCDGIRPRVCMMERLSVTCQTALHVRVMLSIPSSQTWSTSPQIFWPGSRGDPCPLAMSQYLNLDRGCIYIQLPLPPVHPWCSRSVNAAGTEFSRRSSPHPLCLRNPIGFEISWAVRHICAPVSLVDYTHHNPVYTTLAVRPSASR